MPGYLQTSSYKARSRFIYEGKRNRSFLYSFHTIMRHFLLRFEVSLPTMQSFGWNVTYQLKPLAVYVSFLSTACYLSMVAHLYDFFKCFGQSYAIRFIITWSIVSVVTITFMTINSILTILRTAAIILHTFVNLFRWIFANTIALYIIHHICTTALHGTVIWIVPQPDGWSSA